MTAGFTEGAKTSRMGAKSYKLQLKVSKRWLKTESCIRRLKQSLLNKFTEADKKSKQLKRS